MSLTQKQRISARIKASNERVKNGLPPDPWVIEYRNKNNKIKANWKAKQPKVEPKIKKANSGSFKTGQVPHNKKSEAELLESKKRWAENTKRWHKENRERINEQRRIKREKDVGFRLACNLRKRLSFLLRASIASKTSQTMTLLGCTMEELKSHLSSRFSKGMTLENYGEWHVDHILPCDSFDLTKEEDQRKCFHYTNLQPLWAKDNRIKSNRLMYAEG
jgi:hypothetical protein